MRIGITGTKTGMNETQFNIFLNFLYEFPFFTHFHNGDCIGVDDQSTQIVQSEFPEVKVICHPPSDPKNRAFGKYDEIRPEFPYIVRDHKMVDEIAYLYAIPHKEEYLRSGTWATVRYARKTGVPVTIIMPKGEIIYE